MSSSRGLVVRIENENVLWAVILKDLQGAGALLTNFSYEVHEAEHYPVLLIGHRADGPCTEKGVRAEHLPILSTWDAQKAAIGTKKASSIDGLSFLASDTQVVDLQGRSSTRNRLGGADKALAMATAPSSGSQPVPPFLLLLMCGACRRNTGCLESSLMKLWGGVGLFMKLFPARWRVFGGTSQLIFSGKIKIKQEQEIEVAFAAEDPKTSSGKHEDVGEIDLWLQR